jgi:hypothetical protein
MQARSMNEMRGMKLKVVWKTEHCERSEAILHFKCGDASVIASGAKQSSQCISPVTVVIASAAKQSS